jgi:hypothetical protein
MSTSTATALLAGDYADSRDVEGRIRTLENADSLDEAETELLEDLRAFREEFEGYCEDWRYGVQLIPEDRFEEYCKELLADIGDIPKNLPSYIVIDWAATADNLRADYTEGEFRGHTYLAR